MGQMTQLSVKALKEDRS